MSLAPASALRSTQTPLPEVTPEDTLFGNTHADPIITTFEERFGGREAIVGELLTSPEITPRVGKLLQLVFDPRHQDRSLGWLCGKAGIPPGEVFLALRDAMAARATVLAMHKTVNELPGILDDLLKRATTRVDLCETCCGQGKYQTQKRSKKKDQPPTITEEVCATCHGVGKILVKSDLEIQKLALELAGIVKKAGPQVQVGITHTSQTTNIGTEALGGLAQLQQAASSILFGRTTPKPKDAPVIDVTPIEESACPTP